VKSKNPKFIEISGAEMHNLNSINLKLPKEKLVVITGVSGSGKSSLAFDTIYAEGQRRYVESLSSYARQFLERLEKPKVKKITGLSPAIALEQKISLSNPRSTVGTKSEIYDYLKLLFSRYGKTYSPISNKEVKRTTISEISDFIKLNVNGTKLLLLIKLEDINKKNIEKKFKSLVIQNYNRLLINDEIIKIKDVNIKEINDYNNIFLVIDRIIVNGSKQFLDRVSDSISTAIFEGKGKCVVKNIESNKYEHFNTNLELDGIKFVQPTVNFFSFNNPSGACKKCEGYGDIVGIDERLVIPNSTLSVYEGCVFPWKGKKLGKYRSLFIKNSSKYEFPIHKPYSQLSIAHKKLLWDGNEELIGINDFFSKLEKKLYKIQNRVLLSRYRGKTSCNSCSGNRLRKEAGYVRFSGKNIFELINQPLDELFEFFKKQNSKNRLLDEIIERLSCLNDLGLGYLTLNRKSGTLSGGETQRINLAACIGSNLTGSLYILDEPSIGLHPQDTISLTKILQKLKNLGNTVIIVEHDEEIIRSADFIIDIGPYAGSNGGNIVASGNFNDFINQNSLTANYINGSLKIAIPDQIRKVNKKISIRGARENNLKNINIDIPLNCLVSITGVSGSGKSTLVNKIIYPAILNNLKDFSVKPGEFDSIGGDIDEIKFVEYVSQNAIGKSSRSNPITYIKGYDEIRKIFSENRESRIRGYKPKHFSFNVDGGRCENCKGDGTNLIEMQFMPDVSLPCEECNGKKFKSEILEIKVDNKNIYEVLNLTVDEAIEYFTEMNKNKILDKLNVLKNVGLGYIKLGQSSSTLSGGEAQRIKLAYFLSIRSKSKNGLFLFDEPTTGLHYDDIKKLLISINSLVDMGNSVILIEHNMELVKCSDHIIDLGPKGGNNGGKVVYSGEVKKYLNKKFPTAKYLEKVYK